MVTLSKKKRTSIQKIAQTTKIALYDTTIVEFTKKTIKLNSGGFYTRTTKERMNQVSREYNLGFQVFQDKYIWQVAYKDRLYTFENNLCVIKRR